jgi:hypothetical protein
MRILVLATMLLASSSLYPSFAQDEGKAPVAAPQTVPAQPNQNSPPQQDQRTGGDQPRTDNREMGRDWRMHPGDGDRMGHDDREMGRDWRMHRDREAGGDRDKDRERYGERGGRDWDRADRDRDNRGYYDQDRPRRRVKICVEYENGDEYCRYRE